MATPFPREKPRTTPYWFARGCGALLTRGNWNYKIIVNIIIIYKLKYIQQYERHGVSVGPVDMSDVLLLISSVVFAPNPQSASVCTWNVELIDEYDMRPVDKCPVNHQIGVSQACLFMPFFQALFNARDSMSHSFN